MAIPPINRRRPQRPCWSRRRCSRPSGRWSERCPGRGSRTCRSSPAPGRSWWKGDRRLVRRRALGRTPGDRRGGTKRGGARPQAFGEGRAGTPPLGDRGFPGHPWDRGGQGVSNRGRLRTRPPLPFGGSARGSGNPRTSSPTCSCTSGASRNISCASL
jgi:hypothetical protein